MMEDPGGEYGKRNRQKPASKSGLKKLFLWEYFMEGKKWPCGLFYEAICCACTENGKEASCRGDRTSMFNHAKRCVFICEDEKKKIIAKHTAELRDYSTAGSVASMVNHAKKRPPENLPTNSTAQIKKQKLITNFVDTSSTSQDTEQLEKLFADFVVSTNLSLDCVEDPRLIKLFKFLRPSLELPDRNAVARRLIPAQIKLLENKMHQIFKGCGLVTLCLSGFKNARKDNTLGIVASTRLPDGNTVNSFVATDTITTEIYNDATLLRIIETNSKVVKDKYDATVKFITCDSEMAYGNARKLLQVSHPQVVFLACVAHQVDLFIRDVMKQIPDLKQVGKEAMLLVVYLQTSTHAVGALHKIQKELFRKSFAIPVPVDSDWNSYFSTFMAVSTAKSAFLTLIDKVNTPLPLEIQEIINDEEFWAQLQHFLTVLDPLVKAHGLSDLDGTTLADVGTIFGGLFAGLQCIRDLITRESLISALEKRWETCYDSSLIVVAMVLHPNIKMTLFQSTRSVLDFSLIGRWATALYGRLLGRSPNVLLSSMMDYLKDRGSFEKLYTDQFKAHPYTFWEYFSGSHNELSELALILLAMVSHTAPLERGWSQLGNSNDHSRVDLELASGIASMQMHFQREDLSSKRLATERRACQTPTTSAVTEASRNVPDHDLQALDFDIFWDNWIDYGEDAADLNKEISDFKVTLLEIFGTTLAESVYSESEVAV